MTWSKASSEIKKMDNGKLDTNIESTFIILVSAIAVLIFFSFPGLSSSVGLQVTPLSISCIISGAFTGIYIVKKQGFSSYVHVPVLKIMASVFLTPVTAFIIAYAILHIVDASDVIINLNDKADTPYEIVNITPMTIVTLILSLLFVSFSYVRKQKKIRMQVENSLTENLQELFENQKTMSALEIKTILKENEHLNHRLELQRKELINIALNISEQKKTLEGLYHEIKSIKETDSYEEQKYRIDKLEKLLLQKMNFSQEMENFYAQTEKLHKDFNSRLGEKYPDLTENERRLITLLRLGFSSKHIASLMNISPKSVEINRYRLRVKLKLMRDQKLIHFVKSI
jgi:DNA-binding CsgD family transcriptional regulator/phosphate/sulfate permease